MILYKEESYKIIGAAFKVYNTLGPGFLEAAHRSQVYNYLHATGFKLGLLLNFGNSDELEKERILI